MPSDGPEGPLNYWNPQTGDTNLPPARPKDEIEPSAWRLLLFLVMATFALISDL